MKTGVDDFAAVSSGTIAPSRRDAADSGVAFVVCATFRDRRELARLGYPGLAYVYHDYASTDLEEIICGVHENGASSTDPVAEIERLLAQIGGSGLAAVLSSDDYPGSALAAILAQKLGLPGVDPRVNLLCQQKFLSRIEQQRYVPEAVPRFLEIDVAADADLPDELFFPAFIKPVKSFFSIGAQRVYAPEQVRALKARWDSLDGFFLPLERLLQRYAGASFGSKRLLAEGVLKGKQVTVEGYVHGGIAQIIGVVDSIFFPGTLAFSRFDYPSALPQAVQHRMGDIARRLMQAIGYDDGLFNIEMMYDEDEDLVSIIEINPRMASQFADLYEKVDGTNSYEILLDVARGIAPPALKRGTGRYRFAASCVLRTFDDCRVTSVPSEEVFDHLDEVFPGVRVEIHAAPGRRLSEELQDGGSYRYGIVNLGGEDQDDVMTKFEECKRRLAIGLEPAR